MENYFQIVKTVIAAALSWIVVTAWLHWPYPYFAPLAAILTVQITITESVKKAWQRLAGTIGGVIISAIISQFMSIGVISISIVILVGMTIGTLLNASPYVTSQAAVSSLMVLAFSQSQGYALNRITETIIGSCLGIIINICIFPPHAITKAEKQVLALSKEAASTLNSLNTLLDHQTLDRNSPITSITTLKRDTIKSIHTVQLAQESLKFNPLMAQKRRRLAELTDGMRHLEHISLQIRGIHRGLFDIFGNHPDIELDQLKNAIHLTAICIEQFGQFIYKKENSLPLATAVQNAWFAQDTFLYTLHAEFKSLPLNRELGAVLTDLHRILQEVDSVQEISG